VLDAYVAAGGNFIDTADVYARWAPGNTGGESEDEARAALDHASAWRDT
jgi:aryl-alcohol dehydrogenase-like predicted oxidoreductase